MTPSTCFFQMANTTLKLAPSLSYGYNYLLGTKLSEGGFQCQSLYIIVNKNMRITGYSWELGKYFKEPLRYLYSKKKLISLSVDLFKAVKEVFTNNLEKIKEDHSKNLIEKTTLSTKINRNKDETSLRNLTTIKSIENRLVVVNKSVSFDKNSKRINCTLSFAPKIQGSKKSTKGFSDYSKIQEDNKKISLNFVVDIQLIKYQIVDYSYCLLRLINIDKNDRGIENPEINYSKNEEINISKKEKSLESNESDSEESDLLINDEYVQVNTTRGAKFVVQKMKENKSKSKIRNFSNVIEEEESGSHSSSKNKLLLDDYEGVQIQEKAPIDKSNTFYSTFNSSKLKIKENGNIKKEEKYIKQTTNIQNQSKYGPKKNKKIDYKDFSTRQNTSFKYNKKREKIKKNEKNFEEIIQKNSQAFEESNSNTNNQMASDNNNSEFSNLNIRKVNQNYENKKKFERKNKSHLLVETQLKTLYLSKYIKQLLLLYISSVLITIGIAFNFNNMIINISVIFDDSFKIRMDTEKLFYAQQQHQSLLLQKIGYQKGLYSKNRFEKFGVQIKGLEEFLGFKVRDMETYTNSKMKQISTEAKEINTKLDKDIDKSPYMKILSFQNRQVITELGGFSPSKKLMVFYEISKTTNQAIWQLNQDQGSSSSISFQRKKMNEKYLLQNMQNGLLIGYKNWDADRIVQIIDIFYDFAKLSLSLIVITSVVLLTSSTLSVVILCNILKVYQQIYTGLCFLNTKQIEMHELKSKKSLRVINEFMLNNYFLDIIKSKNRGGKGQIRKSQIQVNKEEIGIKSDKKQKKKNQNQKKKQEIIAKKKSKAIKSRKKIGFKISESSFYGLTFTFIFFILFYIFTIILFLSQVAFMFHSLSVLAWIGSISNAISKLLEDTILAINFLEQVMVLGKTSIYQYQNISSLFPSKIIILEKMADTILEIFTVGSTFTYRPIQDRIQNIKTMNLCDYDPKYEQDKSICSMIDSGIAEGGIKQVAFHLRDQLIKIMVPLSEGKITLKEVMESKEWTGIHFNFQNVYFGAYIKLLEVVEWGVEFLFTGDFVKYFNNAIYLTYGFQVISILMCMLAIINIIGTSRKAIFCFQLLIPSVLIGNVQIRYNFMKIFKLNNL